MFELTVKVGTPRNGGLYFETTVFAAKAETAEGILRIVDGLELRPAERVIVDFPNGGWGIADYGDNVKARFSSLARETV